MLQLADLSPAQRLRHHVVDGKAECFQANGPRSRVAGAVDRQGVGQRIKAYKLMTN